MTHLKSISFFITLIILATIACNFGQNSQTTVPVVAFSQPGNGQQLPLNTETAIQSVSVDEQGISRVELVIDNEVIWSDANADPQPNTPFIVAQPWVPTTLGSHSIQVRAYNLDNVVGESPLLTVEIVAQSTTVSPTSTSNSNTGDIIVQNQTRIPTITPSTTPAPLPQPTATPPDSTSPAPTVTSAPTVTPQPQIFSPTDLEPDGRFKDIWFELGRGDSRLGYPVSVELKERNYAKQFFERGLMIWWDNPETPDYIWVLDSPAPGFVSGSTSNLYPDTWVDEGDLYSCEAARNGGPVRGFGKVWCKNPALQNRLGFPSEPEVGSGGNPPYAVVQFFQGGVMFYNPANGQVYVLFEQGDWQIFNY